MTPASASRRLAIIKTAISVFAIKGFASATIADIAQQAKVGEATIYNYFNNKIQLLLSTPVPYIADFLNDCEEQLNGLRDPEEKLRRFIWQTLRWGQQHKEPMKVLITCLLPRREFYGSEAYEQLIGISGLPIRLLEEGQDQGCFSNQVSPRAFGTFLFGTLAYMMLIRMMQAKEFILLDEFDDLAGMIIAAIRKDIPLEASEDILKTKDKKERILLAAEKLFAQKTASETTIAEIARTANVADGTIYDYFKNKEALLFTIFHKRMSNFAVSFNETLNPESPTAVLRLVIFHFLSWVQQNRSWARVYIKDIAINPNFYLSDEHQLRTQHIEQLESIIKAGIACGQFQPNLKTEIYMAALFGPLYFYCIPWALLDFDQSLLSYYDDYCRILFHGICV